MLGMISSSPLDDGISIDDFSLEWKCKKTLNQIDNSEKWCKKN
jgi:hypothetical protein